MSVRSLYCADTDKLLTVLWVIVRLTRDGETTEMLVGIVGC